MISLDQILINLNQKQSFDLAMDFVLRKISSGIRGYSIKDMQTLGKIAKLINKQDSLTFHDDKVFYFNNQVVLAFQKVLQESQSADNLKDVLAYYPIPILDGIIDVYPQSKAILKIRDYFLLAENARKENKNIVYFQEENNISNKAVVAKVDRNKLNQEMIIADDLSDKVKQVGINSFNKMLDKLNIKKQKIESKMEEITERLGPFINSDYSPQDIQHWLEDLSDQGLILMDGIKMDEAVEYVQKYSKLNPIRVKNKDVIEKKTEVVDEVNDFKLDIEKEENRIQKVIQTDLKKIQKQIAKASEQQVNEVKNIKEEPIKEEVASVAEGTLDNISQIPDVTPMDAGHYDQSAFANKLKEDHKKGMSI